MKNDNTYTKAGADENKAVTSVGGMEPRALKYM